MCPEARLTTTIFNTYCGNFEDVYAAVRKCTILLRSRLASTKAIDVSNSP